MDRTYGRASRAGVLCEMRKGDDYDGNISSCHVIIRVFKGLHGFLDKLSGLFEGVSCVLDNMESQQVAYLWIQIQGGGKVFYCVALVLYHFI